MKKIFNLYATNLDFGKIASWSYLLATAILGTKNVIEPSFETGALNLDHLHDFQSLMDLTATAFFIGSSLAYRKLKTDPNAIKLAGICVLGASTALIAGGYKGNLSDASFLLQVISMLPTAWAGLCFLSGKQTLGAAPELVSRIPHGIAGVMQGDIGQVVFACSAGLGDAAIIADDIQSKRSAPEL